MKVPPNCEYSEKAILGCILTDKNSIIIASSLVSDKDFYSPVNGIIFKALSNLFESRRPIDMLTLSSELKNKGEFEKIGGTPFLSELSNLVPSASNISEYSQTVRNKSILRQLVKTSQDMKALGYNEGESLSSTLEKAEQALFALCKTTEGTKLTHVSDIVSERFEEHSEIHEDPENVRKNRVFFGFESLDEKLGGLKPGDLSILAARPAMGKTAFALNIAKNVASPSSEGEKGKKVGIFSLEMSAQQLTDRLLSASMGVDSWKLAKGQLTDEKFVTIGDAMEELSNIDLFIDDSAAGDLLDIKSKCRRLKMTQGLDLIIIDYLQLMSNGNQANRVQEISEISRGLKMLAKELGVPIIALSQLSRAVESRPDKRPVMSDLRESGSIEQDADSIIMLYREEYYEEFSEKQGITGVFIRKNRAGDTGSTELYFDKKSQKFVDEKIRTHACKQYNREEIYS